MTDEEKISILWNWLNQHEEFYSAVDIHNFEDTGRGLKALMDIKKGEDVVRIPGDYLLTMRNLHYSPLFSIFPEEALPPLNCYSFPILEDESELKEIDTKSSLKELNAVLKEPFFSLVFMLMYEKLNKQSRWLPLLKLMPKLEESLYNWDWDELSTLDGTSYPSCDILVNQKRMKHVFLQMFLPICNSYLSSQIDRSKFTFELFKWAACSIWSRGYWLDDKNKYPALLPLADMFNHCTSSPTDVSDYYMDGTVFVVRALRSYTAGEQVWIQYGRKANAEWLNDYGFIYENNPYNGFRFSIPSLKIDRLHSQMLNDQKRILLHQKSLPSFVCFIANNLIPNDLITLLRIHTFDHIDLLSIISGEDIEDTGEEVEFSSEISLQQIDNIIHFENGISLRNERTVYGVILDSLSKVYRNLCSSFEKDSEEYAALNSQSFVRLTVKQQRNLFALRYRLAEKKLLSTLIPYLSSHFSTLFTKFDPSSPTNTTTNID